MSKSQKRSNREVRKPKADKLTPVALKPGGTAGLLKAPENIRKGAGK